jgi:hypothetical protein
MSSSSATTQNNANANLEISNEPGQQLAVVWFAPFLPYLYAFLVGVLSGLAVNGISEAAKNALGSGELTNAMSDKAKESLVSDAKLMNRLVDLTNEAEASGNAANAQIYRNAISNLYSDMANTIENDLRNIQQNNPKMVAHARELISGLRTSAVEVTKPGANLSKFNPQSIRAQIESDRDIASVVQEKPANRANYQQIANALKENHVEMREMGFDVKNIVGLEAAMNIYAEVNNIDATSLFSQSPYRQALADSAGQSAVDNHDNAVKGVSLSTKENTQQIDQVSSQPQLA